MTQRKNLIHDFINNPLIYKIIQRVALKSWKSGKEKVGALQQVSSTPRKPSGSVDSDRGVSVVEGHSHVAEGGTPYVGH